MGSGLGISIAGGFLSLIGFGLVALDVNWFTTAFLLLGIVTLIAGLATLAAGANQGVEAVAGAEAPATPSEDNDLALQLPARLAQLDQYLADGIISKTEYNRKRKQLIDAWAMPPAQD